MCVWVITPIVLPECSKRERKTGTALWIDTWKMFMSAWHQNFWCSRKVESDHHSKPICYPSYGYSNARKSSTFLPSLGFREPQFPSNTQRWNYASQVRLSRTMQIFENRCGTGLHSPLPELVDRIMELRENKVLQSDTVVAIVVWVQEYITNETAIDMFLHMYYVCIGCFVFTLDYPWNDAQLFLNYAWCRIDPSSAFDCCWLRWTGGWNWRCSLTETAS